MLDDFSSRASVAHARGVENSIRGQIGLRFRQTVNVDVRKPRWMPSRLYRWLMRTCVVEISPLVVIPPRPGDYFLAD